MTAELFLGENGAHAHANYCPGIEAYVVICAPLHKKQADRATT